MPWESSQFHPPIQNPKGRVSSSPNAAAMRLGCCLGFGVAGWAAFKIAQWLFGLSPEFLEAKWGPRETLIVAAVLIASGLGGFIGAGLGLRISIKNQALARLLLIVWHFLANGQIVCFIFLGLALGRDKRKLGLEESMYAFGLFAGATVVASLVLFLSGQFKRNQRPQPLLWTLVTVPLTTWVGMQYRTVFHWEMGVAIVFGIIGGLATVFASARFIERDYEQMDEARRIVTIR